MRPNAQRLRELRGARSVHEVAAASGVDWRTIAGFELGSGTDRFQYNALNQLAFHYETPFSEVIEEVPAGASTAHLRGRIATRDLPVPVAS